MCLYNENSARGMYLNLCVYEEFAKLAERARNQFTDFLTETFAENMFFCLLLSYLIGKVWVARMHY